MPIKHYQKDLVVQAVMAETRKDLYEDEKTARLNPNFAVDMGRLRESLCRAICSWREIRGPAMQGFDESPFGSGLSKTHLSRTTWRRFPTEKEKSRKPCEAYGRCLGTIRT